MVIPCTTPEQPEDGGISPNNKSNVGGGKLIKNLNVKVSYLKVIFETSRHFFLTSLSNYSFILYT